MCLCCQEVNYTVSAPEAPLEFPLLSLCAMGVVGLGVSRWVNMATKVEHLGKGSLVLAFVLSRCVTLA